MYLFYLWMYQRVDSTPKKIINRFLVSTYAHNNQLKWFRMPVKNQSKIFQKLIKYQKKYQNVLMVFSKN